MNKNQPSQKRAKGLRKLGVTEDDVSMAEKILMQIPPAPSPYSDSKVEVILGYTASRLRRAKALRILGVSEEDVDIENAKVLGSLGISGRRRSYQVTIIDKRNFDPIHGANFPFLIQLPPLQPSQSNKLQGKTKREHSTGRSAACRHLNKRVDGELQQLRTEVIKQQKEIESLNNRVAHLEDELKMTS